MPWDFYLFQYFVGTDLTYLMDRELILHFPGDVILSLSAVYKGWFDEKMLYPTKAVTVMIVSIKKLNSQSTQGFEEWQVCD